MLDDIVSMLLTAMNDKKFTCKKRQIARRALRRVCPEHPLFLSCPTSSRSPICDESIALLGHLDIELFFDSVEPPEVKKIEQAMYNMSFSKKERRQARGVLYQICPQHGIFNHRRNKPPP